MHKYLQKHLSYRGFKINLATPTFVAAGTVVGAFIGALLTGVVTDVALIPQSETPLLTVDATSPIIKEPAGVFHNECASTQPLQIILYMYNTAVLL